MGELLALLDVERVDRRGQHGFGRERRAHRGVQRLVLGRRDLAEPVGAAATVPAREQAVEQMMRRRVDHDARQVLAADQVDVVDPQVGGHDLVARSAMGALPLDEQWDATPQAFARGQEHAAVHQRGREDVGMPTLLPRPQQRLVVGRLDVEQRLGRRDQRGLDVVESQHSQSRDDLGDRRPEIGHYVCPPAAYLRSFS